jgi:hypothetical protein
MFLTGARRGFEASEREKTKASKCPIFVGRGLWANSSSGTEACPVEAAAPWMKERRTWRILSLPFCGLLSTSEQPSSKLDGNFPCGCKLMGQTL